MRGIFVLLMLALMVGAFLIIPDRSVDLAARLHADGSLYELNEEERTLLSAFLKALLSREGGDPAFAINEKYRRGRLNVLIVDEPWDTSSGWTHGNAAYAKGGDILFIDAGYFREGEELVFSNKGDSLIRDVLAAVRFYTFFIIAHEIGHREQSRDSRLLPLSWTMSAPDLERDADSRAMTALMALYRDNELVHSGVIPPPVSGLTGFTSDRPTPLQHISDHMSYAVGFMADQFFDGPFPILAQSDTHPEFFLRLSAILDDLAAKAEAASDEDAIRVLNLGRSISLATLSIIDLRPTEIEFDYPFQYAYLTDEMLVIVGNDETPFDTIPLSSLRPQRQVFRTLPKPQRAATVRYAWPINDNHGMTMRRDGNLELIDVRTGTVLEQHSIRTRTGDNSCVKRIHRPAEPIGLIYVSYCKNGVRFASQWKPDMTIVERDLSALAEGVRAMAPEPEPIGALEVVSFLLNANSEPMLYVADTDTVYAAQLTRDLKLVEVRMLAVDPDDIPPPIHHRQARIDRDIVFSDSAGRTRYLTNTSLFRRVTVHDAESNRGSPLAVVDLTPTTDLDRLLGIAPFREVHPISGNRTIVNLEEYGVYLVEFETNKIRPLSRQSFSTREQIGANANGDWILFRKYGSRILLFQEGE